MAPAKTPQPIIDQISSAMDKVMKTPEAISALNNLGIDKAYLNHKDFSSFYINQIEDDEKIANEFNLKIK
jgi:tripartite-type tricarboxylate transporter receptor subunit TctC